MILLIRMLKDTCRFYFTTFSDPVTSVIASIQGSVNVIFVQLH